MDAPREPSIASSRRAPFVSAADSDRQGQRAAGRTESAAYLSRQLITYLGNKRALLGPIAEAVSRVKQRMGKERLRIVDLFAGSGVVSRFFKAHSAHLISNDFEDYAAVVGRCYLRNRSTIDEASLREWVARLNEQVDEDRPRGFFEELYAPRDEARITAADRVFYTRRNARRLDNYRRLIDTAPCAIRDLLLGPLLSAASIHANTAGVFKGFYKNRETGIGQFGGTGGDSLARITGAIRLEPPVLSRFECDCEVWQEDANAAARKIRDADLVYLDPPYNQHPYGSNYFMLNLLVHYRRPGRVSPVSGIPSDWRRSGYNVRSQAAGLFQDLLDTLDSHYLLVSFNNEGFIGPSRMRAMLERYGTVEQFETRYNAFRGCRNLRQRPVHVKEQLYLVERNGKR